MSLHDEIFSWVKRQPAWKQELYLRAAAKPELEPHEIEEVSDILLGRGEHTPAPREVTRDDLPGARDGGKPFRVASLSDLRGVNLIADGQTLAFEPDGLNVVYGKNGAGKTGYSRILKHAGRTLRRETVLANVTVAGSPPPRATITVNVGEEQRSTPVELQAPPPAHLARICVADALGAERYLTEDTEVDYAPAVLQSLTRLAAGLKAMGADLAGRAEAASPAALDLRPYGQHTHVADLLGSIAATTSEQELRSLATLSSPEQQQLQTLLVKRAEVEAMQAPKLRADAEASAAMAERLEVELRELSQKLGANGLEQAREHRRKLDAAREAQRVAAATFAAEPIAGVGSETWKRMWEAARAYAEHQGHQLALTHNASRCPLCMQALSPRAQARLARFEEFVKADISRQVTEAEQEIQRAVAVLPDVERTLLAHVQILRAIEPDAGSGTQPIRVWLAEAQNIAERMRVGDLEKLMPLSAPPLGPIEEWVARCRREAAEHAALTDVAEQQRLTRALAELEAREELSKRLPEVVAHLNALKELARLAEAKRKLNTSALSNTMTALSRELIEADLQGALNRHLKALNFNGLGVVVRSKTVRGRALVGLRFKTVDGVPLNSVLSQGEQRRLALAMFLAEMEVLGEANPVVLDDPASSIDQEGRRHIARTLCEVARRQQVIVFTHELSFVHELGRYAPDALPVHLQHVCRNGATVGHVREGLPWEGMKARARRQELQNRLGRLRELYVQQDENRYRSAASEFCVALRAAFERAVEEEILGETVTRRDDTIHTKNLSKVVCTQQICALVDRGVDDCSPWAHDRPLADGSDPPTPDELDAGLKVYGELLELTRGERSSRLTRTPLRSPDPSQEIYAERRETLSTVANPEQREPSRRPA
jgi:hypothetical protein